MLPGQTYTPEDILRIGLRRAWLIVLPLVLCTVAAAAVGVYLPNRYRSQTLIMLVPQRIPDSYVKSTVTTRIEDRLATLKEQILSRSRLERIILDLELYPSLRLKLPMEEVVQRMRNDIVINIVGRESSFEVSYVSGDAVMAQKTTERLASLFIEENLRDRENVAEDTNQFLESQLQDARRRLIDQEKKLEQVQTPLQRPAADPGDRQHAGDSERSAAAAVGQRRAGSSSRAAIGVRAAVSGLAGARSCGSHPVRERPGGRSAYRTTARGGPRETSSARTEVYGRPSRRARNAAYRAGP